MLGGRDLIDQSQNGVQTMVNTVGNEENFFDYLSFLIRKHDRHSYNFVYLSYYLCFTGKNGNDM
jgi:hypothetical protein